MGPVFVLEQFPIGFDIARWAAMLDKLVVHWILRGMHAEFNSNGTLASAVSCRFTLELLCCLKQLAHRHSPELEIFHLARFSAADFCLATGSEYLPQLIDFFENDMGTIVGVTALRRVCAQDDFLICIDSGLYSRR